MIQTHSGGFFTLITPEIFGYCLLLGTVYTLVAVFVGLYIFRRKDIR
ncbi:hypothetical protein [Eubacterium callanderi]